MHPNMLLMLLLLLVSSAIAGTVPSSRPEAKNISRDYAQYRLNELQSKGVLNALFVANLQVDLEDHANLLDIIEFIQKIKEGLEKDYYELISTFNSEKGQLDSDIQKGTHDLDVIQKRIDEIDDITQGIQAENDATNEQIKMRVTQVLHLVTREKMIKKMMQADLETYAQISYRDKSTLASLTECILELQSLYDSEFALLEKPMKNIEEKLKKIPLNQPVQAFAQISTKFSKEKLFQAIQLLVKIKEAISKAYLHDLEEIETVKNNYRYKLDDIAIKKNSLLSEIQTLNSSLELNQLKLKQIKAERDSLTQRQQIETELLESKKLYRQKITQLYTFRIQDTEKTLTGVKEALLILTEYAKREGLITEDNKEFESYFQADNYEYDSDGKHIDHEKNEKSNNKYSSYFAQNKNQKFVFLQSGQQSNRFRKEFKTKQEDILVNRAKKLIRSTKAIQKSKFLQKHFLNN